MPAHSLPETKENWDANAYVTYIKSIAHKFSRVCLCVHKSCAEKGNWIDAFSEQGIEIIEGAEERDANSLYRMSLLFNQFEFVTSNTFGSHVAYASYFGCKVSVAGPAEDFRREYYENVLFYKNAPEVLDIVDEWYSSNYMAKVFPQFCVNPWEASLHEDWAAWQLGEQCKKNQKELRRLLGWDLTSLIRSKTKAIARPGYRLAKYMVVKCSNMGTSRSIENSKQEK